jgi:hypothetical protein
LHESNDSEISEVLRISGDYRFVRLPRGGRRRRHTRQQEPDFRPLTGRAFEMEPATQTIRDDAVDNVEAEASALIATRCEERIERLASDTVTHPAAIVGEQDFDIVIARRLH